MHWLVAVLVLAAATGLSGCGALTHSHGIVVVASTDVWGSVARAVAGRHVAVRSILSGGDIDPHSYEASPADAAAIADATLVVFNGGGYDAWVDRVLARHRAQNEPPKAARPLRPDRTTVSLPGGVQEGWAHVGANRRAR